MKKNNLTMLLLSITSIAVIAAIGGTYAAFVSSSNPIEKDVTAPELGIEIHQNIDQQALESGKAVQTGDGIQYLGGMPGEVVSEEVSVGAAGKSTDCYVRVTVYKSWTEADGRKITDPEKADPAEIGIETINKEDWIIQQPEDDTEVMYFYYKKPLQAGEATTNLMDSFSILKDSASQNSNAYAGLGVSIEFEADAIQRVAAKDAMISEWGITATFDGDNLTAVEEQ